jgi:uncharacterized protein YfbU (UPF0304 family)
MATELEGNENLQRFIALLAELNNQVVTILKTGNADILFEMNDTVEEMYSIQHGNEEEAYTAIEEDCQAIYKNFNAVVTMVKSNEKAWDDQTTSQAIKRFLQNIFDANVRIVLAYGLV